MCKKFPDGAHKSFLQKLCQKSSQTFCNIYINMFFAAYTKSADLCWLMLIDAYWYWFITDFYGVTISFYITFMMQGFKNQVYSAQKLKPLKPSLHCSANFWSIFPVMSSTGGWVVNSLSKLRVSVSLATAGTNGGVIVPCKSVVWNRFKLSCSHDDCTYQNLLVDLFQPFPVDSLEEIIGLETFHIIFAAIIFALSNCAKTVLWLLFHDSSGSKSRWNNWRRKNAVFTFVSKAVIICWASFEIFWKKS